MSIFSPQVPDFTPIAGSQLQPSRRLRAFAPRLTVLVCLAIASATGVAAEEAAGPSGTEVPVGRAQWDGLFHFGPIALNPNARLDSDWRRVVPAAGGVESEVGLSGRRVGVEGQLGRRLGFEISAEMSAASPWRDALVNYRLPGGIVIAGGQFKIPFSLDGTLSALSRDFVFRSRVADAFSLKRDQGVSAEARLWHKRVTLAGGVFSGSTNGGASSASSAHRLSAARVTLTPVTRRGSVFKDLRLGISVAANRLDEGYSDLSLRTSSGQNLTSPSYWVQGTRRRSGADVRWRPGPASISAEYLVVADERREQGNGDEDLAPLKGRGWYVEGTFLLTGENKSKLIRPKRSLPHGGIGAIEVTARREQASLGEKGVTPILASSPRAAHPASSEVDALTVGLNWYPLAGTRLQFNVGREAVRGATDASLEGLSHVLTTALRFQLFL